MYTTTTKACEKPRNVQLGVLQNTLYIRYRKERKRHALPKTHSRAVNTTGQKIESAAILDPYFRPESQK